MKRYFVPILCCLLTFLTLMTACQRQNKSQRIIFVSDQSGNKDIYAMDIDGTNVVQLTHSLADDFSPTWSPDGKLIAFVSNRNYDNNGVYYASSPQDIFIMKADGTDLIQLTDNATTPTWSPDGYRIAFVSTRATSLPNIYVIDIDGANLKQLTQGTYDVHPAWSPDGQYILFSSHRGIYSSGSTDSLDIYVMKSDGTNILRLTDTDGVQMSPMWSPVGDKIVFLSDAKGIDQDYDLFIINSDGTNLTKITSEQLVYSHVTWSLDGKRIVFDKETFQHSNKTTIYAVDADGTNESQLTTISNSFWPVWQPSN